MKSTFNNPYTKDFYFDRVAVYDRSAVAFGRKTDETQVQVATSTDGIITIRPSSGGTTIFECKNGKLQPHASLIKEAINEYAVSSDGILAYDRIGDLQSNRIRFFDLSRNTPLSAIDFAPWARMTDPGRSYSAAWHPNAPVFSLHHANWHIGKSDFFMLWRLGETKPYVNIEVERMPVEFWQSRLEPTGFGPTPDTYYFQTPGGLVLFNLDTMKEVGRWSQMPILPDLQSYLGADPSGQVHFGRGGFIRVVNVQTSQCIEIDDRDGFPSFHLVPIF